MDWKVQNNICSISLPASAGSNIFIAEQLSTPQGSCCVNKAEDEAVREAAAGGGGLLNQ
jgi:hypothetical protein